tara:strand:- start:1881 stop:2846 length:966 start_codon:yes stop_codon:yes gene_type:complete
MIKKNYSILIITPIKHIKNLKFNYFKKIKILENPSYKEVHKIINNFDVLFTNPNMSKVFIDKNLINKGKKLKCISTASTGTNHIDKKFLNKSKIKLISLTKDYKIIKKISSTAEHALALTLAQLRNIIPSSNSVKDGKWEYKKFIGRQLTDLKIGVIGYGRLGSKYASYFFPLKSKILVYDPKKKIKNNKIKQVHNLTKIFKECDIVSLHVHVENSTVNMINNNLLNKAKKNLILVNTSRGEIVNEIDLIKFLKSNNEAKYATDVLNDEIKNKKKNVIIKFFKKSDQILVTPHIGGMTREAQEIAYGRVLEKTISYLKNLN